jgi:tRNA-2-methylthio-N6-dimethylallyladenosine synthase
MLRRYSAAEYIERTDALRKAIAGLTLSTDIIVGFSGETEEDFAATLALTERVGFVAAFGFKYSVRPHTPAERLADDVSEEEKSSRLARLFALVDAAKERHLGALVGTKAKVLVEGEDKRGGLFGRSERNEIVHLAFQDGAGAGLSSDLVQAGSVVEVEIERAYKNSLLGRPVALALAAPDRTPRAASVPGPDSSPKRLLPVVGAQSSLA